jgi:MOSC domain-containing protein YiiM
MPKLSVEGPVAVGREGVEGDRHRNLKYHGGPNKAVLMIAAEAVEGLAARGYPVYPGALGENFTVAGIDPALWESGQRYRIGDEVTIELTTPREPCANLNVYGKAIRGELDGGLGGYYARVLQTGMVAVGDTVAKLES